MLALPAIDVRGERYPRGAERICAGGGYIV
jgi:hypothetical protein